MKKEKKKAFAYIFLLALGLILFVLAVSHTCPNEIKHFDYFLAGR